MRTSPRQRPGTATTYIERVNRAIDRIHAGLDQSLRLDDLARAALLSPHHFHRVFQALVGETPADFVKRLRLEKALGLMAQPRAPPLTRIALACGFASSAEFARSFRQRFGCAPSAFDLVDWRNRHAQALTATLPSRDTVTALPADENPDAFQVSIRKIPARTVAYIRVARPYQGDGVMRAVQRLATWAQRHGYAGNRWLGYQWDNPEITTLDRCAYYIGIEATDVVTRGEIGCHRFPAMTVAEIAIRGSIDLELRALRWYYGVWLPRSGYVPDDQPGFEAMIGEPFAHGGDYFELDAQMPIQRP